MNIKHLRNEWERVTLAVLLCLGSGLAAGADWAAGHRGALLEGVKRLPVTGIPGPLALFETNAFVVVAAPLEGRARAPLVAGALWNKGRVLAFGHNGYLGRDTLETPDAGRLFLNAVKWAAGKDSPKVGTCREPGALEFLRRAGVSVEAVTGAPSQSKLDVFDVLVVDAARLSGAENLGALRAYVEKGGGLVVASLGWGWLQLNPGKTLVADHPGNQLLAPAGLAWIDGYFRTSGGAYAADQPLPDLLTAPEALAGLQEHEKKTRLLSAPELSQAASTLIAAGSVLPPDNRSIRPELDALKEQGMHIVPREKQPLKLPGQAIERLKLSQALREVMSAPPDKVRAHPARR